MSTVNLEGMTKEEKIQALKNRAAILRQLQYHAANAKRAAQFGKAERELDAIYRELDRLEKGQ